MINLKMLFFGAVKALAVVMTAFVVYVPSLILGGLSAHLSWVIFNKFVRTIIICSVCSIIILYVIGYTSPKVIKIFNNLANLSIVENENTELKQLKQGIMKFSIEKNITLEELKKYDLYREDWYK